MFIYSISFMGYNSPLKTNWRKGNFPTVRKGFYGDTLTQENVSLEHLLPHSKGGQTKLNNLVLASSTKNSERGNDDITKYATKQSVLDYLIQFIGIKTNNFNGDSYISAVIKTLKALGLDLTK